MKRMLVGCFAGVLSLTSFVWGAEWLTNYDQALDQAKKENKQILVDFTGSDWCGPCMMLEREVFEQPEFKEYADKHFVLLRVDFPHLKSLSAEETAQNRKLADSFQVAGFPTLVVLAPDGSKVSQTTGYIPGGPKAFISAIEEAADD